MLFVGIFLAVTVFSLSGCTLIFQKGRRKDVAKITKLKSELSELERARTELEDRLRREIDDREVSVEMMERGLVITFVAEVLFSSGKDTLREESLQTLSKVANVLNTTVRDLNVGVEGHTDNVPIKYSRWKSNWELSGARALSVLHYLAEEHDVNPVRLSATGFGEYHPVASNADPSGQQKNRRVEIVILPKISKESAAVQSENLK
jgi:chemotaxis protein MotB